MFAKSMMAALVSVSFLLSPFAHADGEIDGVLERNKVLEQMTKKEQKLKLQAEMSKHYNQMEQNGFFVDENGDPLGVGSLDALAVDFRNGDDKKAEDKSADPFAGMGPVIPREALFGNQPLPTLGAAPGQQGSGGNSNGNNNNGNDKKEEQKIRLIEVRQSSIVVDEDGEHTELRNGQKIGEYKLARFEIDRAYLVDGDGKTKVISFDWTSSKRYSDD